MTEDEYEALPPTRVSTGLMRDLDHAHAGRSVRPEPYNYTYGASKPWARRTVALCMISESMKEES